VLVILLTEDAMDVKLKGNKSLHWFFELEVPKPGALPFTEIGEQVLTSIFDGYQYTVQALRGGFSTADQKGALRMLPHGNRLRLDLSTIIRKK